LGGGDEDVVYADEDGAAEFDGDVGVVPGVDRGGAATDVGIAFEYGDGGIYAGYLSELREVVCRG
jgi:hypothetical protein